jgi:hypothetical protein
MDLNIILPAEGGELTTDKNDFTKVKFRQQVMTVQEGMKKLIEDGVAEDLAPECVTKHYFTPIDEEYGCCTYAREIFLPKGSVVIGKIHKHQHLNFISKGKVSVATEFGKKYFEAPCTFISEVGLKRAVYAEEDTIWTTVHLTKFCSEEDLHRIEEEVISPTYEEMGLIGTVEELNKLENKGESL